MIKRSYFLAVFIFMSIVSLLLYKQELTSMEERQKTEQWLILGAGTTGDVSRWNGFFKDKNIQWKGLNIEKNCLNCIVANFNNTRQLNQKIPNDFYDVILFDRATAEFSQWNKRHLEILNKKLKDTGKLYIPFKHAKINRSQDINELLTTYKTFKQYYDEIYKPLIEKQVFLNGVNYYTPYNFTKNPANQDKFFNKYTKEIIVPYNIKLLKSVFGPAIDLYDDNEYPLLGQEYRIKYYLIFKGQEQIKKVQPSRKIRLPQYHFRILNFPSDKRKPQNIPSAIISWLAFFDKKNQIHIVRYIGTNNTIANILKFINSVAHTHYKDAYIHYNNSKASAEDTLLMLDAADYDTFGLDGLYGQEVDHTLLKETVNDLLEQSN